MYRKFAFYCCTLIIAACCLSASTLRAQTIGCTQKLANAQARFDIGHLVGIPEDLQDCINSKSFSPEQEIQAHKLITLVYLYQDDEQNADLWMAKLLTVDPEHKLDPSIDPAEIIYLKSKFRYNPIFRVSVSLGGNGAINRTITRYGVGQLSTDQLSYQPKFGFNGFGTIEKEIYKGVDIGLGIGFVSKTFESEEAILFADNTKTITEKEGMIDLPVFAKYTYYGEGNKMFNPYVFMGGGASFLLTGSLSGQRINASDNSSTINISDPDLIALERRNRVPYYIFGGIGVKIRRKTNFFFVDVKYTRGMSLVNAGNRYSLKTPDGKDPQNLVFTLGDVDNNFTLDGIMASVGFQLSIYNPLKIKE